MQHAYNSAELCSPPQIVIVALIASPFVLFAVAAGGYLVWVRRTKPELLKAKKKVS
jgi:hypothetical protein